VILHDRTLEAIAASLPHARHELASLPGIGPAKLEAYGDEILSLVASVRNRTETG
jgi:DNA helicase-2/ATP-dependent DNA helicase PcrA